MPPAFNLSQDQTLQFNLAILSPGFNTQTDLTQSEFTFYRILRLRVSYFYLCLELIKST